MSSDSIKFYNPENGDPLHRVPVGATIPKGMPHGLHDDYEFVWMERGLGSDFTVGDRHDPRFTADPIHAPMPSLPTEVCATIRATNKAGEVCEVMTRTFMGRWFGVDNEGRGWALDSEDIADWSPVRIVPNGLGVMDESDKRSVLTPDGQRWDWVDSYDQWMALDGELLGTKAAIAHFYGGPLTFADGSAS